MRVVFSSSDPMETLQKFNSGYYSVITLLDMLEMLDVKETIREDQERQQKIKSEQQSRSRK